MRHSHNRHCFYFLVAVATSASFAVPSQAEELLRWDFKVGETYEVRFHHTTITQTSVNKVPLDVTINLSMKMTWKIDNIDATGCAKIKQSFDHLSVSMDAPGLKTITFDSAKENQKHAAAQSIANAAMPLIGKSIVVTLTARGEITDVTTDDDDLPLPQTSVGQGTATNLFSKESVTQILHQSLCIFPAEKVQRGDEWTLTRVVPSPLGKLHLTTTYTYESNDIIDGSPSIRLTTSGDIKVTAATNAEKKPTRLVAQSNSGYILLDPMTKQIKKSFVEQKLTTEKDYRDTKVDVTSQSTVRMTMTKLKG
ncbi:MAG: DUF6263 family protein [Pirellulaceae bacterium]|nr:DUF6263 family protein [Pirellulaceae bacterium]